MEYVYYIVCIESRAGALRAYKKDGVGVVMALFPSP